MTVPRNHASQQPMLTMILSGAQQNSGQSTQQPPAIGSSLFGGNTQQQQSTAPSLFGNTNTQPQQGSSGGSLFGGGGGSTQQAGQSSSSLFGGANTQNKAPGSSSMFSGSNQQAGASLFSGGGTQQQTGQTGGSLFGGGSAQQPQGQAQTGGSLFGGNSAQQQQGQGQAGSSLFGGTSIQPQQSQAQTGSSLFGGAAQQQSAQTGSSLFGGGLNTQNNNQGGSLFGGAQSQAKPAGGLFGNTTNNAAGGSSLFGGNQTNNNANTTSLFGNTSTNQAQSQQQQTSVFGLSAMQPQQSLLGASQFRGSQIGPYAGKLTMGQSNSNQQVNGQNATRVDENSLRSTSRFGDCIDEIKKQLEMVDEMVQAQERFCRQIEAFLPKHEEDVKSVAPDVSLVTEKVEAAENALAFDAQGVDSQRRTLTKDRSDVDRCTRVVDNQTLKASQYHYPSFAAQQSHGPGSEMADMDLVGNYFDPLVTDMQKSLDTYASNLAEIEAHMRVVEGSAVAQAQNLAARRNGAGAGGINGDHTVRDLAETLRGFEGGILGAANLVGACREGVNELVFGKVGAVAGGDYSRNRW